MKVIDVVIVTYKCYKELAECLASVKMVQDRPLIKSCVVIDNSPEKGYWGEATKKGIATVIENDRNEGFAKAVNKGVARGNAPYVLILNPDTILPDGTISRAIDYMEENRDVGVLGPQVLESDGSVQGSARAFPSFSTFIFGRASMVTRLFPENKFVKKNMPCFENVLDDKKGKPVDWVSGAAMFIRRDALEAVGLFDEGFFMYWEDAELCQRMRNHGWQVVYYPSCQVTHYVGRSSRHHPWKKELFFHKSALRLASKKDNGVLPWRTILVAIALNIHMGLRLGAAFLKMK